MGRFRDFLNNFNKKSKGYSTPKTGSDEKYEIESCSLLINEHLRGTVRVSSRVLIENLKTIEEFGDIGHIYAATMLCTYPDDGVRKQSWKTIEVLLRDVPVQMLPSISYHMRQQGLSIESSFRGIERDMPLKVIGILSFNRNGFIREVALKELITVFNGKELPFIILAANDWVANIHVLASDALEKRANKSYAPYLVENLSLLRRLWKSGRHFFGRLQIDIESLVSDDLRAKDLPGLFSIDSEKQLWQYAYNLCLEAQGKSDEEVDELIKFGLSCFSDMRIQQIAASRALKLYAPERLHQYLPILLQHHLAQIRREALRFVVENQWDDYRNTVQSNLFDRSMSVRLLAQFHMDKEKTLSIYEENLRDQKYSIESTLRGLFEIKADVAEDKIEPFLRHRSGKVRAAAFALLFAESPPDLPKVVMRALSDPSSSCAREAFKFLQGNRELLSANELWELLSSNISMRSKRTAISAIAKLGKWQSLENLVLAQTIISPELQEHLDHHLSDWARTYNRSFVKLQQDQYERCMNALEKCGDLISENRRQALQHMLKDSLK